MKNSILSFGLVSIEVKIDNAVKAPSKDVNFDSASPNGEKVRQVYVDDAGEQYSRSDLAKGKFVGDEFREIPSDQIDAIKDVIKSPTVDLHFAPAKSVNTTGGVGKHYVMAREGYEDKLRLLIEGMKKSKTVFVAKWVPVSRQALVVGMVEDNNLVLVQIPFASQRKDAPESQGKKPEAKMVGMAVKLIESSMDENFVDEAIDEGVELKKGAIQAVIDGKPVKQKAKPVTKAKAEDLEELLAASLN